MVLPVFSGKKEISNKPTPRERLPRRISGEDCISKCLCDVREAPVQEGNRTSRITFLCKPLREVLRPDDGGEKHIL